MIPFTIAEKYSLKGERDKETLSALNLDVLLVMGWQRLLPDWFLETLTIGAFGMHGSSKPLPHGRGRSPLNWSLIQNRDVFYTHLFRYQPGVDDGPIVAVQRFDINIYDTCLTLHFKNTLSMIRLCLEHLPKILRGEAELIPQSAEGASYYPKRTAEDGLIYWSDATHDIYNLVRAITKPFPGAFAYLNDDPGQKIYIWEAQPFDTQLTYPDVNPGTIVEVFHNGMFLVKTGDATLLVTDWAAGTSEICVGFYLSDLGLPRKVWGNLPD